jgi:hypothetical protein
LFTITRRALHQFRIVARKALSIYRGVGPSIVVEPAYDGLCLRIYSPDAAVALRLPGDGQGERICMPFELCDDCQAKNDQPVTLTLEYGKVVAQWQDGNAPQLVQYDQPESPEGFSAMPTQTAQNPPELLRALRDASAGTDPAPTRYALSCVQLDGDHGRLAASDGHQIFMQTGFDFPWEGALLLPARKLFDCPHLPRDEQIAFGRTEDWLTMLVGPWTFHFRLNVDGRFPRVEECIPRDSSATTKLEIAEGDAEFLLANVKRLPVANDWNRPVTLDLNGEVVVRARGDGAQPVTELALVNSTRSGDVIRINTNRDLLARALALGFRQVRFIAPDQPAFCRDENRAYVWAPLGVDGAIPAAKKTNRIESPRRPASKVVAKARPITRSKTPPMSESNNRSTGNTNGNGHKSAVPTAASEAETSSPIEQAEALRDSLKDALDKTRDLVRVLKRQKKASRIVESTLASLRQLQTVDL